MCKNKIIQLLGFFPRLSTFGIETILRQGMHKSSSPTPCTYMSPNSIVLLHVLFLFRFSSSIKIIPIFRARITDHSLQHGSILWHYQRPICLCRYHSNNLEGGSSTCSYPSSKNVHNNKFDDICKKAWDICLQIQHPYVH